MASCHTGDSRCNQVVLTVSPGAQKGSGQLAVLGRACRGASVQWVSDLRTRKFEPKPGVPRIRCSDHGLDGAEVCGTPRYTELAGDRRDPGERAQVMRTLDSGTSSEGGRGGLQTPDQ